MRLAALLLIVLAPPLVLQAEEPAPQEASPVIGHPFSWPFVGWEKMKPFGGTTKASTTELNPITKESFEAIYDQGLTKREQDRRAIVALAGDYRVSFDFIEVASSAEDYQPPRPYFSWATERAMVIADEEDFVSLQHIMVMEFVDDEGVVQGPFVMKHWRQDWSYQDRTLVEYRGDQTWAKRKLKRAKGTWVQAVYQVDDSPRYQTVGKWSHEGGLSIFRSEEFWRPLPRREFSVRDDYNVLAGRHEITVTPTGWLHTQLNQKLVTKNGQVDKLLATELGAVRYEQIKTPSMAKADDYWEATQEFWGTIRSTWESIEEGKKPFTLEGKVEDQSMYGHLFTLAGQYEKAEAAQQKPLQIEGMAIIGRFLSPNSSQKSKLKKKGSKY